VDDAAIETVHWLEAEGLARLADALGDSAESRNELAALIGAVALDIDDNALRGFLGRVGQPVHEKLEVFEGMALATDQAARIARAHLKDDAVCGFLLVDLEHKAQRAKDHLQDITRGFHPRNVVKPALDVKRARRAIGGAACGQDRQKRRAGNG